jgi:hypothetical protein
LRVQYLYQGGFGAAQAQAQAQMNSIFLKSLKPALPFHNYFYLAFYGCSLFFAKILPPSCGGEKKLRRHFSTVQ